MPLKDELRKDILFPLELTNRDLDYRLLLGALVSGKSNRVWIGHHDVLFESLSSLEGGLYVGKHIFPKGSINDQTRYNLLKSRGFSLVHLDDEGQVGTDADDEVLRAQLRRRFDATHLQPDDYICTWGEFQRETFAAAAPQLGDHVLTTGHPRFELAKPQYREFYSDERTSLNERFGNYILVNMGSATFNSRFGLAEAFSTRWGYDPSDVAKRRAWFARWSDDAHVAVHFVSLASRLSVEFPEVTTVVRPHPSEDPAFYSAIFSGIPNVFVVEDDSPVIPWLLGCAVMVHHRSTTAVDAFLADAHTVQYRPLRDRSGALGLADRFGVKAESEDEAVAHIEGALSDGSSATGTTDGGDLPEAEHRVFANFRVDAMQEVSQVVRRAEHDDGRRACRFDARGIRLAAARRTAFEGVRRRVRPLFPEKQRKWKSDRQKFSGLDTAYLAAHIERSSELTGTVLRWEQFGDSLVVLESD